MNIRTISAPTTIAAEPELTEIETNQSEYWALTVEAAGIAGWRAR